MSYDEEKAAITRATEMSLRVRLARSRPVQLLSGIAFKCWVFCGAYVLVCIILYWLYGGLFAFVLLGFATTGNNYYYVETKTK